MSITQSSSNSSQFSYAPDKHRYYQSAMIAGVSETTVYAGAFEAVTTGGVTKYRYHLSADSREVAEVDLSNSGSTVNETVSYILSDHLGSVDVVRTFNAATGALISTTNMSFSAWGGRWQPATWLPPVTQAETQADHQANRYGFTHHEMLDNVGIVHMNGRIYDPNLGRFLSVDPVFEFPTNTQSLNPYSYVLNNPLSMTDPTGYNTVCIVGTDECIGSEDNRDSKGNLIKPNAASSSNGATNKETTAKEQQKDPGKEGEGEGTPDQIGQQSGRDAKNTNDVTQQLGKTLLPTTTQLGERGTPGSTLDNLKGAGTQLLNTAKGLLSLTMAPETILAPQLTQGLAPTRIPDNQLLGASIAEMALMALPIKGVGLAADAASDTAKISIRVGDNASGALSKDVTYLYQKVGANGEHLKFGITKNPEMRYTQEQLGGGRLRILESGPRQSMLELERNLHQTLPIGPEEAQRFYIQMQTEKGLLPPPYKP